VEDKERQWVKISEYTCSFGKFGW